LRCPWCGELVPDEAPVCHRCGNKLKEVEEEEGFPATSPGIAAHGDWRAVARARAVLATPTRRRRTWRYGIAPVFYGALVAAIALWIGLSLTIWGNPSPVDRAKLLLQALERGDEEAFLTCFQEEDLERGRELWEKARLEYGPGAAFRESEFRVESDDGYEAVLLLEKAMVEGGKLSGRELSRQDNIVLFWENHGGSWYLDPNRSRITPP
jgi:hypothetical protein